MKGGAYAELRNLTMSDAVYALLREAIGNGNLPEGAVLRERDVAELHNVSRTPVREALRRLLDEQLLIRQGKCLVVATRSFAEVKDGLSLRGAIMQLIVDLAIERATPADIDKLAVQVSRLRAATNAGDHKRVVKYVQECDRSLFAMAHSPLVSRAVVLQVSSPGLLDRMLSLPNRAVRTTEDRERILLAIRDRNRAAGASAVRKHIRNAISDLRRASK